MRKAATFIALGVALVLAASSARADPPPADLYGFVCDSLPAADQPTCHRCVDRAGEGKSAAVLYVERHEITFLHAVSRCQERMKSEHSERQTLLRKFGAWRPRDYEGAKGNGIEDLSNGELEALPATEQAALERINEISIDLGGNDVIPADKVAELLAEARGFVAKERTCRADDKCMAARAARRAAEEFFASVAAPMCDADKARETALAGIAKERANTSGVVDLNVLHALGAQVQDSQQQIKDLSPAYTKFRHHEWTGWRSECQ